MSKVIFLLLVALAAFSFIMSEIYALQEDYAKACFFLLWTCIYWRLAKDE